MHHSLVAGEVGRREGPMKARGMAQHGGPPGWLVESDLVCCPQNPWPRNKVDFTYIE